MFSTIVLTLFPEMFPGPLGFSLAGKALQKGLWSLEALNIRDFALDKHKTVDDSPYGGGVGMVMKPDVVDAAVEAAKRKLPNAAVIYLTPRGTPMTQALVQQLISSPLEGGGQEGGDKMRTNKSAPSLTLPLKGEGIIILCGRFEGVDQRVIEHHGMLEVSLGDFVLSGGEIAALAMLDACVRLLPGVIGKEDAIKNDSFSIRDFQQKITDATQYFAGLLEYPHYTRPSVWKDKAVPDVLLSGNHEQIESWRLKQAKAITAARRPDLTKKE